MTGRVCPVHGEYAADGVCRWCEPEETPAQELARINAGVIGESPGTQALRDAQILATYERKYLERIGYLPPATTYMGVPIVVDPHSDRDGPVFVSWPKESAVAKAFREQLATRDGMRPLFSTRQRYSTPEGIASHNAFWEGKLAEEHAALRWERVARRWATKAPYDGHVRTVDGTLAHDDRCAECRALAFRLAGIPKEPKS